MKTKLATLVGGFLAGIALACHAQTLEVRFLDMSPSLDVPASLDGGATFVSYESGLLVFDSITGFCVDPYQPLRTGERIVYTIQDPATLATIAAVSRIVGGFYASGQTALDAAGAHWAIWEVVVDGLAAPSFASGVARLQSPGSAVGTRAMSYLDNLGNLPAAPLMHLTHPTRQDVVTLIPESGAAMLGCLGAALLVLRRNRRA
jgi:hypothetical protein